MEPKNRYKRKNHFSLKILLFYKEKYSFYLHFSLTKGPFSGPRGAVNFPQVSMITAGQNEADFFLQEER